MAYLASVDEYAAGVKKQGATPPNLSDDCFVCGGFIQNSESLWYWVGHTGTLTICLSCLPNFTQVMVNDVNKIPGREWL